MNGNPDGTGLVRNRARDGLANPPGCIGAEFIALPVIELFHGLDKPQIAFLDQIEKLHAASHIPLGDADYQS